MYRFILIILLSSHAVWTYATEEYPLWFQQNDDKLYLHVNENASTIDRLIKEVRALKHSIIGRQSHIAIVSYVRPEHRSDLKSLNTAALRASVSRSLLKKKFTHLDNSCYTFAYSEGEEGKVGIELRSRPIRSDEQSEINYTGDKHANKMRYAMEKYEQLPYVDSSYVSKPAQKETVPTQTAVTDEDVERVNITLFYRWDKHNLDSSYLTNRFTLNQLDSLMSIHSLADIDSLRITAYASPEGPTEYNKRLSMRRANTVKDYITKHYPKQVKEDVIKINALGENWDGFRAMALKDKSLPMREQVLSIINDTHINDTQRQRLIERVNGGQLYRSYILPKYYRTLRSGATVLFFYNAKKDQDLGLPKLRQLNLYEAMLPIPEDSVLLRMHLNEIHRYIRPIAFKTNLLGDLLTLFNIEVEFPIGKHFSLMGEWTFPFWGGLGNQGGVSPFPLYSENNTVQLLSGGLELRYWFKRSKGLEESAQRWGDFNPLTGWFVGLYGNAGLYDLQLQTRGMQGEFYTAGLSGGYAHPISKYFHMEYSLSFGYLSSKYYNYTGVDGHKVVDIRPNGQFDRRQQTYFGPTKAKVSLIWIPRFKVKKR